MLSDIKKEQVLEILEQLQLLRERGYGYRILKRERLNELVPFVYNITDSMLRVAISDYVSDDSIDEYRFYFPEENGVLLYVKKAHTKDCRQYEVGYVQEVDSESV